MSAKSRNKGARGERAVVAWLRSMGWPDARRYLAGDGRQPGDIDWHPLVCLEVKDRAKSAWPSWCRQTVQEMRPGMVPAVVRKTAGVLDVSRWEVRVRQLEWLRVLDGSPHYPLVEVDQDGETWVWAVITMDALASAVAAIDERDEKEL